jgi:hypothetical protein
MREPKCRPPEVRGSVHQRIVAQLGPRQHGGRTSLALAGIGEVEEVVLREVGMQADVEQAALATGIDPGHAADRPALQPAVGEDPQPSRPLGDQQPPVGQEGHAPRLLEVLGEGRHAIRHVAGTEHTLRTTDHGAGHHRRGEKGGRAAGKKVTALLQETLL